MNIDIKHYKELFNSSKDCILIIDAKSDKIIDANPAFIELLNYTKEELLDKSIWDISPFINQEYSKKLFKELQEKKYIRYSNIPLETINGKNKEVEFVSNVYSFDGKEYIQCNIRDTETQTKIKKSLTDRIDEKDGLLDEIQHRTKNSFTMITSLISLKSNIEESAETKQVLDELTYRVLSISELYTLLYETKSFDDVDIELYFNNIIKSMINLTKPIEINKNIESIMLSSKHASTIAMILVELISNAIKYAFIDTKKAIIDIIFKKENSQLILEVKDNGIGLQEGFDINKIKSTGLNLVVIMVNQLDGDIKFFRENGTKVIIKWPI